jgi:hypothetical protein
MLPTLKHFGGKKGMLKFWDGGMNDKWVNYSYKHVQTKQQVG